MGRGGASSGGGGRSSGGGGGRSFGGRSGGGGFSRGGVSSGRSGGSNRGGLGGGPSGPRGGYRPPPRHRSGSGLGPFIFGYGLGRSNNQPNYGGGGHRPGGGIGSVIGTIVVVAVFIVVLSVLFGSCQGGTSTNNITASTIEREALPAGSVNETDYYTDELGWIGNSTTLTSGMKNFYKATGVQPYLYITDTIDDSHSPTDAQVAEFSNTIYEELFTDEAHMLFIFFEYGDTYHTWYLAGSQAKTVLDNEAMDIMLDYIDRYYYDQSLTDEQMFSKAFTEAGQRIMEVTTSPWVTVLIVAGVFGILIVLYIWWRNHKKQKNLEAEQTQTILETPLETFGDTEAEQRTKKYEDQ